MAILYLANKSVTQEVAFSERLGCDMYISIFPRLTVSHVSYLSQGVQHGNLIARQHAIKAWAPGHDTSPEILPVSVQ